MEELQAKVRDLEGRLSESHILNHQLQMSVSEGHTAQLELRRQLDQRTEELRKATSNAARLQTELEELSDEHQAVLEGHYGGHDSSATRRQMSLRGSVSIVTGATQETRWVQTSDDMMPTPFHVEEELHLLRAEVANLRCSLERATSGPRISRAQSQSEYTSDSGDLRSDNGDFLDDSQGPFVPPPPLNLRLNLVMPPALQQQSSMLHEEASILPDDTPRFASLTGRLRADQPLNLTQALAQQSQRQLTSRRYLSISTPRIAPDGSGRSTLGATPRGVGGRGANVPIVPALSGFGPHHSESLASSMMSPRLSSLASKLERHATVTTPPQRPRGGSSHEVDGDHSSSRRHVNMQSGSINDADDDNAATPVLAHTAAPGDEPATMSVTAEDNGSSRRPAHRDPDDAIALSPILPVPVVPTMAPSKDDEEEVTVHPLDTPPAAMPTTDSNPQHDDSPSFPNHSLTGLQEDPTIGARTTRRFHINLGGQSKRDAAVDIQRPAGDEAVHMFSLGVEDPISGARCHICDLMQGIKENFSTHMTSRQAYYAAGFIPEMCERWQLEHEFVWTIEERASIATSLFSRPPLSKFSTWHLASEGKFWRHKEQRFWKSNWKDCFLLLQGVFLYVFHSAKSTDTVMSVSLIRSAKITVQRTQEKLYVLRLECLGCGTCVGAGEGEHVDEVLIGFKSEETMIEWKETIAQLSMTCPHMCSSKFANSVSALRGMCEDLLTMSYREEKKAQRHAAVVSSQGTERRAQLTSGAAHGALTPNPDPQDE